MSDVYSTIALFIYYVVKPSLKENRSSFVHVEEVKNNIGYFVGD